MGHYHYWVACLRGGCLRGGLSSSRTHRLGHSRSLPLSLRFAPLPPPDLSVCVLGSVPSRRGALRFTWRHGVGVGFGKGCVCVRAIQGTAVTTKHDLFAR